MAAIVYIATNRINGKRYIGVSSKRLRWRRAQHEYEALKGKSHCRRFHNAMRKYGVDAFEWREVFQSEDYSAALAEEMRLIAETKPEYNLTNGGEGNTGRVVTLETRAAISARVRGRKLTEEHKRKISESGKLRKKNPETGLKISAAKKGMKFTDAHRAALSAAHKGKPMSAAARASLKTHFVKGMKMDPGVVARREAARQRTLEARRHASV